MSTINSITPGTVEQVSTAAQKNNLNQSDFLRLMTTQLQNQDPLKPMDGTNMLSQLAQFSTVQGVEDMKLSMDAMASVMESDQTLRAASLLNHDVMVVTNTVNHTEGQALAGETVVDRPGTIQINVTDSRGNIVARRSIVADQPGIQAFKWDGLDDSGNKVASGTYRITASSDVGGDQATNYAVRLAGRVTSVNLDNYTLGLVVSGIGTVGLGDVSAIQPTTSV